MAETYTLRYSGAETDKAVGIAKDYIADEYNSSTSYKLGDLVTYTNNGYTKLYNCLNNCSNIVPTNTSYWSETTVTEAIPHVMQYNNASSKVRFNEILYLTKAQYDAITTKDPATLYCVTDEAMPSPTSADNGKIVGVVNSAYTLIDKELPAVTSANNGEFLRVVNGTWSAEEIDNYDTKEF